MSIGYHTENFEDLKSLLFSIRILKQKQHNGLPLYYISRQHFKVFVNFSAMHCRPSGIYSPGPSYLECNQCTEQS